MASRRRGMVVSLVLLAFGGTAVAASAAHGIRGAAPKRPAGANATLIKNWADPRPAAWKTKYPLFAPPALGDGSLQRVQRAGQIKVCAQADAPPFVSQDPSSGKLVGLEPDQMADVARRLGIKKVSYVITDFASLIASVQTQKCDVGMSGLAIKTSRAQSDIRYTWPNIRLSGAIVVRSDSSINSIADLAGKTIGAGGGEGAVETLSARAFASSHSGTSVLVYEGPTACIVALKNKTVDACWDNDVGASAETKQVSGIKTGVIAGYTYVGPFAQDLGTNPYLPVEAAPITQKNANDLNTAIAIALYQQQTDGTKQRILSKYGLWSPLQKFVVLRTKR